MRRENEVTARHSILGVTSKRVSGMYKSGPDLQLELIPGHQFSGEVKGRRKDGTPLPTLKKMKAEADVLFIVEDWGDTQVVMNWKVYRELLDAIKRKSKCGRCKMEFRIGQPPEFSESLKCSDCGKGFFTFDVHGAAINMVLPK